MLRILNLTRLSILMLALTACENSDEGSSNEKPQKNPDEQSAKVLEPTIEQQSHADETALTSLPASAFKTVEWTDLIPKEDLEALINPPSYVAEVEEGSFEDQIMEDQISSQVENTIATASDDRYQQALVSTRIIPEMDGQAIRIPGFIVPLEFDDDQTITQFFLVPFFGACIHVPPPPPNQIIFVNYPKGIKLDNLYDPFWISGTLKTSLIENEMAIAAYTMQMQSFSAYAQ